MEAKYSNNKFLYTSAQVNEMTDNEVGQYYETLEDDKKLMPYLNASFEIERLTKREEEGSMKGTIAVLIVLFATMLYFLIF